MRVQRHKDIMTQDDKGDRMQEHKGMRENGCQGERAQGCKVKMVHNTHSPGCKSTKAQEFKIVHNSATTWGHNKVQKFRGDNKTLGCKSTKEQGCEGSWA